MTPNVITDDVSVLLGDGQGGFLSDLRFPVGLVLYAIAVADFDLGGNLDVVVTNSQGDQISVLLGNGNGTLQTEQRIAVGITPLGVAVADVNLDGSLDIVTANFSSFDLSLVLGNSDGTFQVEQRLPLTGDPDPSAIAEPAAVAVGDINLDGLPDIVATSDRSPDVDVSILLANQPGIFDEERRLGFDHSLTSVALADIDGNNTLDIIASNEGSDEVLVFLRVR